MELDTKKYLKTTHYIDHESKSIKDKVNEIIKDCSSDKEKAILIHDFVRDSILFGFNRPFYDMTASQVLEAKVGFCNNKSTLFVAMLRAANIPSRTVFVDISKEILNGIVDPPTPY
ncbi:transglutaminase, partial [Brachionus plicatilis]